MTKNSELQGEEIILSVEDVDTQNIQPYQRGRKMSFSTNSLTQNHISNDIKSIEKDETMSIKTLESELWNLLSYRSHYHLTKYHAFAYALLIRF